MTQLVRTASLLLTFYLLTSSATAYAACAWVLWSFVPDGPTDRVVVVGHWSPARAFESHRDCEAARAAEIGIKNVPADEVRCLPDSIDPRGPKRK